MHPVIGGVYAHYNGKPGETYRVMGIAKLRSSKSEGLVDVVIYRALYPNPVSEDWALPLDEWAGIVHRPGFCAPRFRRVD